MINNALSAFAMNVTASRWRRKWASNHNLLARADNGDAKGPISAQCGRQWRSSGPATWNQNGTARDPGFTMHSTTSLAASRASSRGDRI